MSLYRPEHDQFRASYRTFLERNVLPYYDTWDANGIVPRELFVKAGELGFLGMQAPAEFGGGDLDDWRFNAIIAEESSLANVNAFGSCLSTQNDICLPYLVSLGTPEQKQRWLPGVVGGEIVTAIAMTEPGAGSDIAAITTSGRADGEDFVVNGSKTFITNGINADLVIVVVRTDNESRHHGLTLLVVERGMRGFSRGRNLSKVGLHAQDTAELFFEEVRVPRANVLGEVGKGFGYLMHNLAMERLSIAVSSLATARAAFGWTAEHVRSRTAFGKPIGALQNTRFVMADMHTEISVAQAFLDRCIELISENALSAEEAAMAKLACTELEGRVVDRCVQLHGGYGYMNEYPIARAYVDARITRIYGGSNEIMREIIGRWLKLS